MNDLEGRGIFIVDDERFLRATIKAPNVWMGGL
jgi:hypothetical protein